MFTTAEMFQRWAGTRLEKATDRTRSEHHRWLLPAPDFAMSYVNNGSYMLGDGASESACPLEKRQNNVEVQQARSPDSPLAFQSNSLLSSMANENTELMRSSVQITLMPMILLENSVDM